MIERFVSTSRVVFVVGNALRPAPPLRGASRQIADVGYRVGIAQKPDVTRPDLPIRLEEIRREASNPQFVHR